MRNRNYSSNFSICDISTCFLKTRDLAMCELTGNVVPPEIMNFEQGESADKDVPQELSSLLNRETLCRANQKDYIKCYTAMVHCEEAAQSAFIAQFNTKNIRLMNSDKECEFRIRNDVSLH